MRRTKDFPLDERVYDADRWATSFQIQAPVLQRLEELLERAIEAGESRSVTRPELLAALICAAPDDGGELRKQLERFRLAKTRDVLVRAKTLKDDDKVIPIERFRAGRRAR